jgi:cytoskeletal protein RodZ
VFLPDILATMSQTIVIKQNIAELVTSRTGIVCEGQTAVPQPVAPAPEILKSPQYAPTQYAVAPERKKRFGDDVSPTVKVLTAIVALLIIIGGTVAVVLAVQNSKKTPEQGTVGNMENVADEPVTIDVTLRETTTQEETTSEAESLTADETTTEETTTAEETTAAEETTTAEENTTEASTTQAEDNENENSDEDGNYAVG